MIDEVEAYHKIDWSQPSDFFHTSSREHWMDEEHQMQLDGEETTHNVVGTENVEIETKPLLLKLKLSFFAGPSSNLTTSYTNLPTPTTRPQTKQPSPKAPIRKRTPQVPSLTPNIRRTNTGDKQLTLSWTWTRIINQATS